jgi:hypothetical protein
MPVSLAWVTLVIVALQLSPDEPEAGRWHAQPVTDVAAALLELGQARAPITVRSCWPWTGAAPVARPHWPRLREGAIAVPAGCPLLVVEGVGAARRECAHLTDASLWVQADEREAERRSLARVGQPGESPTVGDLRGWMAEEVPFLSLQRPWERADLIACGTPEISFDPAAELVVSSRPGR